MWQQLLGVQNVDLNADFFQLGGHSLIAVSPLSVKFGSAFQVDLGLATLFESPHHYRLGRSHPREPQASDRKSLSDSLRCVVPIRSEGTQTFLFTVSTDMGGNVLEYDQRLVRYIPSEQPAVWHSIAWFGRQTASPEPRH
jgi:hypothetical protein